jgi:DNA helicase-2/ATP-dependent DNA helicase PcrA
MIYSGNSFFERAEVKDMMAYFKLVVNINDDESFKRIVNKPTRGIGDTSLSALTAAASNHKTSLFKAAFAEDLEQFGLKQAAIKKIREFCNMIGSLTLKANEMNAHDIAKKIADESGLYMFFKMDTSIEGQSRTANVEELVDSIKLFIEEKHGEYIEELQAEGQLSDGVELTESDFPVVTLGDYLENASLLSAVDVSDEESSNKIALMTVHSSKGLEFPYVYVAGMEENIFPSGGFMASDSDIEEERRLFYVAMTRAKKVLQLSFAQTRLRNGKHESNSPSRFVREVDQQFIANPLSLIGDDEDEKPRQGFGGWGRQPASKSGYVYGQSSRPQVERRPVQSQPQQRRPETLRRIEPQPVRRPQSVPVRVPDADFEPTPILQLRAGQRIEHNRFGYGKILEISGNVSDLKAKISFDDHGEKILILKYAKIRAVDLENK